MRSGGVPSVQALAKSLKAEEDDIKRVANLKEMAAIDKQASSFFQLFPCFVLTLDTEVVKRGI